MVREVAHARERNRLCDRDNIFQDGRYPQFNHLREFWSRSVKGLGVTVGSNVALPV